jgi:hypothetical protein
MRLRLSHLPMTFPLLVAAITVAIGLVGCGGSSSTDDTEPPASNAPGLTDVSNGDQLRRRFDEDAGVPRLVLLLSPT